MERTLPRTPRNTRRQVSRALAVVCTLAVASGPLLVAHADDLHDKKKKAQQGVKHAQADLEDSSNALQAASVRLRAVQSQLAGAQQRLAAAEGQLTAARVLDRQMQAKLAQAVQALEVAQAELTAGIQRVRQQRADIGRLVATNYQYGDPRLLRMSMVLRSQDPEELAAELGTVDSVLDKEAGEYERLQVAEKLLRVQEKKVAAAKALVAQQRQEAAVNLARRQRLEKEAADNRAHVATLVGQQTVATRQAAAARAADLRRLRQAKAEETRIKKLILARARKHKGKGYTGSGNGFLLQPVANSYVTSPFGWRKHPIYGYWGLHNGTDFHAPCGTPLRAAATGTVIEKYYSDVWGNRLFVDVGRFNGKAMTLVYNHISSYKVGNGATVGRGDTVAYAGTTGWSTACHLHFTVLLNGNAVNPEQFF
ncbi:MAG: peptidoglycan DD-metalloendopeptidase family protein [Nocardioidaceae bacterium]|nr:peptidoglycan DD-metalloendopeptidase family protein [Nocardioidaceae bacterium]